MTNERVVSEQEWGLVKWIERLLTPLLLVTIVGGFSAYMKMASAQAQAETRVTALEQRRTDASEEVREIKTRQDAILGTQHTIEVTVERVETNQLNFKEQIRDIKIQNNQILQILRDRDL